MLIYYVATLSTLLSYRIPIMRPSPSYPAPSVCGLDGCKCKQGGGGGRYYNNGPLHRYDGGREETAVRPLSVISPLTLVPHPGTQSCVTGEITNIPTRCDCNFLFARLCFCFLLLMIFCSNACSVWTQLRRISCQERQGEENC